MRKMRKTDKWNTERCHGKKDNNKEWIGWKDETGRKKERGGVEEVKK